MKSISVTIDKATWEKAEKLASQKKTSVARLLQSYLKELTSYSDKQTKRRQLLKLSAAAKGEVGTRTWTRDELYDR